MCRNLVMETVIAVHGSCSGHFRFTLHKKNQLVLTPWHQTFRAIWWQSVPAVHGATFVTWQRQPCRILHRSHRIASILPWRKSLLPNQNTWGEKTIQFKNNSESFAIVKKSQLKGHEILTSGCLRVMTPNASSWSMHWNFYDFSITWLVWTDNVVQRAWSRDHQMCSS